MYPCKETAFIGLVILLFCLSPLWAFEEESILPSEETAVVEPAFAESAAIESAAAEENTQISGVEEPSFNDEEAVSLEEPSSEDLNFDDFLLFETAGMVFEVPHLILEPRSIDDIFPDLTRSQKRIVRGSTGLRNSFEKNEAPLFKPSDDSGIELFDFVMSKKPSHIIEALVLVPYGKRELDMLDVYNSMREISVIKDQTITLRDNQYKVFRDTTRLESARNRKPVPDPAPASELPYSETMYLRFTDATIGELFIQGDIKPGLYGITYNMTNFRDVNYSIFKVMKAQRFSAVIYVEPVKEGVIIYGISGLYLPGFIVSRMNLPNNMNYRISVLLNWIVSGLRKQESVREKAIPFAVN